MGKSTHNDSREGNANNNSYNDNKTDLAEGLSLDTALCTAITDKSSTESETTDAGALRKQRSAMRRKPRRISVIERASIIQNYRESVFEEKVSRTSFFCLTLNNPLRKVRFMLGQTC